MKRRNFMEGSAASLLAALPIISGRQTLEGILGRSSSQAKQASAAASSSSEWSLAAHMKEWMESSDYKFPWDNNLFHYGERIVTMKGKIPQDCRFPIPFSDSDLYYARLNIRTRQKLDLKVLVGSTPNLEVGEFSINNSLEFKNVDGSLDITIPLDLIYNDTAYYRIFYKRPDGKWWPISPTRAFKNPRFSLQPMFYSFGDDHKFDDNFAPDEQINEGAISIIPGVSAVDCGLNADFFIDFLKKNIANPDWINNVDAKYANNLRVLQNTFLHSKAFAYIIKQGILPDFILSGGDDLGIHSYRYKRQGLSLTDHELNSWILYERERKVRSPLSFIPTFHIEGNHDGGGKKHNPAHPFATQARKTLWEQAGELAGGSKDQNYYKISAANGDLEIFVLDVVAESASPEGGSPYRPEHFQLGAEQTKWLEDELKKSTARIKLIAMHHVLGGEPANPDGSAPGGYGRGNGITKEHHSAYERLNPGSLNVEEVQQWKIHEIARNNGVLGYLLYHDHIQDFTQNIGVNNNGRPMFVNHPGTTNEVKEENDWAKGGMWVYDYGTKDKLRFVQASEISRFIKTGDKLNIEAICIATPSPASNLSYINPEPKTGTVLKTNAA